MTEEIIVTPEGKKKLEEELNQLKNVTRKEISERIELAKEHGDLSENAEYHEARNEQSFSEGRILEIENILKNAIVAEGGNSNHVQVSSKLVLESNGNEFEYTIVGSHEGDPGNGLLSCDSPIGQAVLGKSKGDTIKVEIPKGITIYKIKKVE